MDKPSRGRNLGWFAVGFGVAFLALLFLFRMDALHPSGRFVMRQRLFTYYSSAVPRSFLPTAVGPGSGSTGQLAMVVVGHLGMSVVGGGIAALTGRWLRSRMAVEARNKAARESGPASNP